MIAFLYQSIEVHPKIQYTHIFIVCVHVFKAFTHSREHIWISISKLWRATSLRHWTDFLVRFLSAIKIEKFLHLPHFIFLIRAFKFSSLSPPPPKKKTCKWNNGVQLKFLQSKSEMFTFKGNSVHENYIGNIKTKKIVFCYRPLLIQVHGSCPVCCESLWRC